MESHFCYYTSYLEGLTTFYFFIFYYARRVFLLRHRIESSAVEGGWWCTVRAVGVVKYYIERSDSTN